MSEFDYNGVTVPLPVGHVFEEVSEYDGSLDFTNDGGVPATEDRSVVTGLGSAVAGNKFHVTDAPTDLFAEGARVGDKLSLGPAANPLAEGVFTILDFETISYPNDTVVVDSVTLVFEADVPYVVRGGSFEE